MIRRTNRLIVFILLVGLLLSLTSCSSVKTEEKSFQAFTVPVPEGWTQINLNDVVAKDYLLTWFIPEGTDASENIEAGMIVFVGQAYAKGTTPYGPYEFGQSFTDLYNIYKYLK